MLPITSQLATSIKINSKGPQHRLPNTMRNLLYVMNLNAIPHDGHHVVL
jgi:hypothetical protein